MPLVIKAVETYGRQNDAYRQIGLSRDLPQTEETIAWVIDELNAELRCRRMWRDHRIRIGWGRTEEAEVRVEADGQAAE